MAQRRIRRGWEAVAIAAALNAGFIVGLDQVIVPTEPLRIPVVRWDDARALDPPAARAWIGIGGVTLLSANPPALPLDAILGPGDDLGGTGTSARPDTADLPGARAADRGGGAEGGTDTFTGRRDRDDAALRRHVWTSDQAYLAPRSAGPRPAASPEAITRRPDRTYGDRAPRVLAAAGADRATEGDADGTGNAGAPIAIGPEVARTGHAGATVPARRDGATTRTTEAAFVDPGAQAVDVTRRGPTADDRAIAASSDQRRVDPFDYGAPRSGGRPDGEGVRGAPAPGAVTDGWGRSTGASRGADEAGEGGSPTYASRRDPYFLELFRRLDQRIEYPQELAIALQSGRVVAEMTLRADGSVADIGVHATSGHAQFDDEVTGALRGIGKLGPVPAAILAGRGAIRVRIPYTFRSPMIQ